MKYYFYNLLVEDDVEQLKFGITSIENSIKEAVRCLPHFTGLDFNGTNSSVISNENIDTSNYQSNSSTGSKHNQE